jgi:hypothetical protein
MLLIRLSHLTGNQIAINLDCDIPFRKAENTLPAFAVLLECKA